MDVRVQNDVNTSGVSERWQTDLGWTPGRCRVAAADQSIHVVVDVWTTDVPAGKHDRQDQCHDDQNDDDNEGDPWTS